MQIGQIKEINLLNSRVFYHCPFSKPQLKGKNSDEYDTTYFIYREHNNTSINNINDFFFISISEVWYQEKLTWFKLSYCSVHIHPCSAFFGLKIDDKKRPLPLPLLEIEGRVIRILSVLKLDSEK